MQTRAVKLTFRSPVHFGAGRLSDSECSCDAATLFSALYLEALKMGCADDLLDAARSGELGISNAFPYADDTFFLPKPMIRPVSRSQASDGEEADSRARKAAKKIDFVSADRYANFIAGDFDPISELERFDTGAASLQTKVNLSRVNKDDAEPYHVGGFSFREGAGLYFLVQGAYNIAPIIEQLGYSGLGGERSSGYGRFESEIIPKAPFESLTSQKGEKKYVLLSSAAPKESELTDQLLAHARYRLLRKGGFVQSSTHNATPQKKRDMYLFAAGSVFARTFAGDVFDVNATPGAHPVYRYAQAMWMEV
ncbi:type III-A CRISPR-associated RAMP protein Csm4 [Eggerthellaceae bacterium zg-887]|uniref:type III-A CRISPR-associated RAMP protein Csm4 n=1 Tax=Xiamenia xianingshaonis TaxID=2682776 RepID=UPI00140A1CCD|nr:type III-A CRISPR-associated RAMP protein Csm4 [Xiamenia xianingshaonis]NHM16477.1 type III-A CRISPR-associated RAMP protein Csm4 [Xiamenia xianingshaonis]